MPCLVINEAVNIHMPPTMRALSGPLRSDAPHFIDLSLAQSQESIERDLPDNVPKDTVWEPVYVDGLPVNEKNRLTYESYRKTQRAVAAIWQTRVKNNESYGCDEQDLPEAPDYLSHHQFGDAYVWETWEKEARRNLMGVKLYLNDHPRKKEELQKITLSAKSYWNKHPSDFEHYFPLTPEWSTRSEQTLSSRVSSSDSSRSLLISGDDAVLADPAIVSIKPTQPTTPIEQENPGWDFITARICTDCFSVAHHFQGSEFPIPLFELVWKYERVRGF